MHSKVIQRLIAIRLPDWVRWGAKALVTAAAVTFVVFRVSTEAIDWNAWWIGLSGLRLAALVGAFLLLPMNLGLEVVKWRLGFRDIPYPMSPTVAWRSVLVGIGLGLFTPNRLGEYAGRLWPLPAAHRWRAGLWTWLGRIAQMICTCLLGLFSLAALLTMELNQVPVWWPALLDWGAWVAMLTCSVMLLVLGLYISLPYWQHKLPASWYRRLGYAGEGIPVLPPSRRLIQLLCFSVLRYCVFTLQYALLLWACGAALPLTMASMLVGLVFLVKSFFPTLALAELGVRESVALAIMGGFGVSALAAVVSTLLLFLLNLALPGLIGIILLNGQRKRI